MGGCCEPHVELTANGKHHKDIVEIILYTHLGLSLTKAICFGLEASINDWMACLILCIAMIQHNFCNLYIYMLLCVSYVAQITFLFLFALQIHKPFMLVVG